MRHRAHNGAFHGAFYGALVILILAASQGVGFSAGGLSHSGTKAASEQGILDTVTKWNTVKIVVETATEASLS